MRFVAKYRRPIAFIWPLTPDREGEAISWHVYELLNDRNLIKNKTVERIVFYEITESAVGEALRNPRTLSTDLINAQQARRALDYLVGFNLSPLLWKKIRPGLSAGRVQSPALRMIVERELEIEAFVPEEYWTIEADSEKDKTPFTAKLTTYDEQKLKQFDINNADQATDIRTALLNAGGGKLTRNLNRKKAAQAKTNSAFYHFYPTAGSLSKVGIYRSKNHADCSTALRRS